MKINVISKKIKQYPISSFFILTYFITWSFWAPQLFIKKEVFALRVLGTFGPMISAIYISNIIGGRDNIKNLLKPLLFWKFNIVWYIFCLFSTAFICFTAIGISFSLGTNHFEFNELSKVYLVIPIFMYVLIFSVLGEEIGWRGFALKHLQTKTSALSASIIIGIIWGFWHLPLFFIAGNFHQTIPISLFILQEICLSIVLTWIYNNTNKSLISVHIFHAASNTTLGVLPILPIDTQKDLHPLYITIILLLIFAICIILSKTLSDKKVV
jgi:membrane protease YdiL (CAAX protease family)